MRKRSLAVRGVQCVQALLVLVLCAHCGQSDREFGRGNAGASGSSAGSATGGKPSGSAGRTGASGSDVGGTGADAGANNASGEGGEAAGAAGSGGTDDQAGASGQGDGAQGGTGAQGGGAQGGTAGASGGGGAQNAGSGGQGGSGPKAVGSTCSVAGDCALGNCVDGVCCESACTGCKACSNDLTGKNDGTCAAVISGKDPHNQCADETGSNQCGSDGMCDGAGACRKVSSSHVCSPAACSGSNFSPAATCDGQGACKTVTTENCGAYPCAVTGCAKTCTAQADCSGNNYCKIPSGSASGTCAAKNPNGTAATQPFECGSNIVADGVCCDQACSGCRACSGAPMTGGAVGQCLNVLAGNDAHNACTASGKVCGLDGACDGAGACRSTPKEGQSCSDDPGNQCITGGTCKSGGCSGATAVTCPAPTIQCRQVACVPATGCTTSASPNNTPCDDGLACTAADTCSGGVCNGAQITCNSPPACHQATTCSSGSCTYPNQANGVIDASCPAASGTVCFAGNCVKCTADSHCAPSTVTPSCNTATHNCVCRIKDSGNLLTNPNFNGNMTGWTGTQSSELRADVDTCSQSNSLFINGGKVQQCVAVTAGTKYFLGTLFTAGAPGDDLDATFYSGAGCTGTELETLSIPLDFGDDAWRSSPKGQFNFAPSGAKSALVWTHFILRGIDQIYFGTVDRF